MLESAKRKSIIVLTVPTAIQRNAFETIPELIASYKMDEVEVLIGVSFVVRTFIQAKKNLDKIQIF